MYENAFNSIERELRNEAGIANELDYVEQISWVLFLKYLHDLEVERRDRAELSGESYTPLINPDFGWEDWAAPKTPEGKLDHNEALVGDDLIAAVDRELFPYLASFRQSAASPRTIEYKIGEIFTELRNKFRSGYILRDVLEIVDGLAFNTQAQRHELSELYESRIRRMGNAGRNGGEYYTPRPLIRAMVKIVDPKIGETVYDGAAGSAGFLCEAWEHMRRPDLPASDYETLQRDTFFGQEKKSLAYIISIMNMVLHGIEAPNIVHTNTLNENVMDFQERDRHDIVLANPPFGGGRAAVVIKNTFLSNTDNASVALRRELLEACTLHTILDCPSGTFQGAGVKTVVLFFEKGAPTRDIWFYQLDPGRSLGKSNPLNDDDLAEFVGLQRTLAEGPQSWPVALADLDEDTLDLSVKNPHAPEEAPLCSPEEIIDDMLARDAETAEILENIRGIL